MKVAEALLGNHAIALNPTTGTYPEYVNADVVCHSCFPFIQREDSEGYIEASWTTPDIGVALKNRNVDMEEMRRI